MSIKNPYRHPYPFGQHLLDKGGELGFDEGVKAAVQYLEDKCDKHREHDVDVCRFMCLDCMAEIHKELGL